MKKLTPLFALTIFFLLFQLSTVKVFSQNAVIKGTVKTVDGKAVDGASVSIKGETSGVITDGNGAFAISVPHGKLIVISGIGYQTVEIKPVFGKELSVELIRANGNLDEVVVVGYGSQKKVNLSGSIVALKGESLARRNTLQTSQALQGMAAGVTVTSNNGKPGKENTSIRIRGIGTINDNNPLVLVDGVASSVDAVDPNDIESISILKDAASSSIYGSRAANGVILITTKRGKSDKVMVTYKGSVGFTKPLNLPKNATAWDYMTLYNEANGNDLRNDAGVAGGAVYSTDKINTWKNATDRDAYPNSDMIRETYKNTAAQTQQYLGFSVGNGKFNSNTSLNFTMQNSNLPNTDYKRYGIRSNNSYTVSKYLEFGFDLSSRNTHINDAAPGTEIEGMLRQPAIYPTRYSNGVWGSSYAGTPHTMQTIFDKLNMRYEDYQEILARIYTKITPFKGMQFLFSYTPKINTDAYKGVTKQTSLYDYKTGVVIYKPSALASMYETRDVTNENDLNALATYTKSIGRHDITLLSGYQYLTNNFNELYGSRQGNNFQQFEEINAYDPTGQITNGYTTQWALQSYFGRLNYAYSGKYLFEANVRYDGSSRFANGYKWGIFPSFSGAWRFSSENFMNNINWLQNGKLRASWGKLGNQSGLGSNYPFAMNIATNRYTVFGGVLNPGYAPVNYALNDITWETTSMIDLGTDLSFFKGKLEVSFDWFKKQTENILLNMAIPGVMGYANSPKQNAGSVENKGYDITISHNNTIGKFYYKVTGILSDVKNQITNLGGLGPQINGTHVLQVGSPIDAYYGLQADGLFPSFKDARTYPVAQFGKLQGGDVRYKDLNADNKITGSDRVVLGNPIPRYTYSLDLYTAYKGFDFALFLQGVGKHDSYDAGWDAYPFQNASTLLVQHLDRWSEANPNPNATTPRLSINQQSNNLQPSSFWLINAAYLRLKNIQLGYTLPAQLVKKAGIADVRFFVSGNNVVTWSKMPVGIDPESPESTNNYVPILSTYTFGVEIEFL
ncbi:TonB-dependent receptor [Ginsengibacter hankyongi]|uniref:TonB-dependent receptor n=1 Tax=Ginsengibacter hankyongi TaxID=2607284 RepID=A0A5J5IIE9_9BACT|nr:TonB-dependent receptor [Ginsengibacter hankyongi]KAA9040551.1 TonB-dependent receptor [Ginsengibacter hankyongi]